MEDRLIWKKITRFNFVTYYFTFQIGEVDMQAIELCSRKIASMTGDIRFALQIGRQMLLSVESFFFYFFFFLERVFLLFNFFEE